MKQLTISRCDLPGRIIKSAVLLQELIVPAQTQILVEPQRKQPEDGKHFNEATPDQLVDTMLSRWHWRIHVPNKFRSSLTGVKWLLYIFYGIISTIFFAFVIICFWQYFSLCHDDAPDRPPTVFFSPLFFRCLVPENMTSIKTNDSVSRRENLLHFYFMAFAWCTSPAEAVYVRVECS